MVLRYIETDYMTYKEDELLFNGSREDCYKYLLKVWSVDKSDLKENDEVKALFIDYLRHIYYSNKVYKDNKGKYLSIEELEQMPDVRYGDWDKINFTPLIFEECEDVTFPRLTEDNCL